MSNPRLPEETLDHIVNHLHDSKLALKNCCLVSKTWIPRARNHLFAEISFPREQDLGSWKKTFPDHQTSPAYYAKTLRIGFAHLLTPADGKPGSWIHGFSRVGHLELGSLGMFSYGPSATFVPLHGFSPVKSLLATFVIFSTSEIFDLILSFPLLEDLTMIAYTEMVPASVNGKATDGLSAVAPPSNPPVFTGSLELSQERGIGPIARRLLSLPSGIHFRKLKLMWHHEDDCFLTTALVRGCSSTLESLDITYTSRFRNEAASLDLSTATRLKDLVFRVQPYSVAWVTTALRAITPRHRCIGQISIYVLSNSSLGHNVRWAAGEQVIGQWLDLDRLLVHLWESRSIRPKVRSKALRKEKQAVGDRIGLLLPEITTRGIIDLAATE